MGNIEQNKPGKDFRVVSSCKNKESWRIIMENRNHVSTVPRNRFASVPPSSRQPAGCDVCSMAIIY